jgi:hypothetical protein
MIVVSLGRRMLLYSIPELSPVREGFVSQAITVTPLVVPESSETKEQQLLWNSFCSHHTGNRLPTAGSSDDGGFYLVVLPPAGQQEDTTITVHHGIAVGNFGPSRAIWSKQLPWTDRIELQSCTYFTRPDDCVGYMRLGRSKSPDPSRLISIPIGEEIGDVFDLSWDEQSGLIFLLVIYWDGDEVEKRQILTVDLI